jgi:folate-binding protein YgfZ
VGIALIEEQVRALDEGRAFVEQTAVHLTHVSGSEARTWLGDLVTADVATLDGHESRPSLLLTPTGRIRAALHLLGLDGPEILLAQSDDQPETIAEILGPYVLSSDVTIAPSRLRIFSVPGRDEPPVGTGNAWRPSILGDGFDLLVVDSEDVLRELRGRLDRDGLEPVAPVAAEARRIRRAEPAFPIDLGPDGLPAEAGWEDRIDFTKGCFLGQEAAARVRNLGHPTRVVLGLVARAPVEVGEPLLAGREPVGEVTGVASLGGGWALLARIRWDARDRPLTTATGLALDRRSPVTTRSRTFQDFS